MTTTVSEPIVLCIAARHGVACPGPCADCVRKCAVADRVTFAGRYALDGEALGDVFTEFIAVNELDPAELRALAALAPGASLVLGGGAWAEFTVQRIA